MTVIRQDFVVEYEIGTSYPQKFPFEFGAADAGHIKVYDIDPSLQPSDEKYRTPVPDAKITPNAAGIKFGGTVDTPTPLAAGHILHIRRETPSVQATAYQTQREIEPKSVELALDYLTMVVQEAADGDDLGDVGASLAELRNQIDALGKAKDEIDAHVSAPDPHPQYALKDDLPVASTESLGAIKVNGVDASVDSDGTLQILTGGGTTDHRALKNRDAPEQHSTAALTHGTGETKAAVNELLDSMEADIGSVKATANALSNPNILINTDFRNPVNQRGNTTVAANKYLFDRWLANNAATAETSGDTGARVQFGAANAVMYQRVEAPAKYINKSIILSARVRSNKDGIGRIYIYKGTGGAIQSLTTTEWSVPTVTTSFSGTAAAAIQIGVGYASTANPAEDWVEIEWIKLEEGSVATAWQVPDPAVELARCQRYCQVYTSTAALNSLGIGIVTSARGVQIPMSFSQMRATPTVSLTGAINVYTANSTHTPATIGWANASSRSGQFSLVWSADEFSSTNLPLRALLTANSKLVFDAEI